MLKKNKLFCFIGNLHYFLCEKNTDVYNIQKTDPVQEDHKTYHIHGPQLLLALYKPKFFYLTPQRHHTSRGKSGRKL